MNFSRSGPYVSCAMVEPVSFWQSCHICWVSLMPPACKLVGLTMPGLTLDVVVRAWAGAGPGQAVRAYIVVSIRALVSCSSQRSEAAKASTANFEDIYLGLRARDCRSAKPPPLTPPRFPTPRTR